MSAETALIVSLGASTPVGRDAWATAAAVRAGIAGFGQHPYMIDSVGQPMMVACAPWLDIALNGVERLGALLFPAIEQALQPIAGRGQGWRVALALAVPAPRPGLSQNIKEELLAGVRQRYPEVFSSVATFASGHAAGLIALQAACRRLGQGSLDACVVAGVDSYIDPQTLEWLEANDQLHGAGALNNAWGFIPGEGSGAMLLVRSGLASELDQAPLSQVLSVGCAVEENRMKTESVCIGAGLTEAFREVLRLLPAGETISDVYCDMNGEPYRADEYGFACLRIGERFQSAADFVAPADCWGDLAAAGAPLQVALATIAGAKGYASGDTACIWASSETGERAASLLRVLKGEDAHAG